MVMDLETAKRMKPQVWVAEYTVAKALELHQDPASCG